MIFNHFSRDSRRKRKKRLLDYLLSNCTCDGAHLEVEFRQPFKIIAEDTQRVDLENDSRSDDLGDYEKWLPEQDSNLRQAD